MVVVGGIFGVGRGLTCGFAGVFGDYFLDGRVGPLAFRHSCRDSVVDHGAPGYVTPCRLCDEGSSWRVRHLRGAGGGSSVTVQAKCFLLRAGWWAADHGDFGASRALVECMQRSGDGGCGRG